MGGYINGGTPKSSIFMVCSILNQPFGGTPVDGNQHVYVYVYTYMYIYDHTVQNNHMVKKMVETSQS